MRALTIAWAFCLLAGCGGQYQPASTVYVSVNSESDKSSMIAAGRQVARERGMHFRDTPRMPGKDSQRVFAATSNGWLHRQGLLRQEGVEFTIWDDGPCLFVGIHGVAGAEDVVAVRPSFRRSDQGHRIAGIECALQVASRKK
jgi:hypothetical protein